MFQEVILTPTKMWLLLRRLDGLQRLEGSSDFGSLPGKICEHSLGMSVLRRLGASTKNNNM
jgi:hypothetical protein